MNESRKDPELRRALADAASAYRGANADYDAGLIDEAELQAALFRAGTVFDLHDLWLLEPNRRSWWHYDGIRLESTDVAMSESEIDG